MNNTKKNKKKNKLKKQYYHRRKNASTEQPMTYFNIKLFVTLVIILSVLLMKKYDFSVGQFNIDTIYDVVYYNEDLDSISNKVLKIGDRIEDTTSMVLNQF